MKNTPRQPNNSNSVQEIEYIDNLIHRECKYTEALAHLERCGKKYSENKNFQLGKVGLLIDAGIGLGDLSVVEKGIEGGERILKNGLSEQEKSGLLYNIANGLGYKVKRHFMSKKTFFGAENTVRDCIKKFQNSLSLVNRERALVNLGNFYNKIGRPLEALVQHEKAITRNPKFGMAIGNKASLLQHLAPISSYYTEYLIYAYQLLSEALKNEELIIEEGGVSALEEFKRKRENIRYLFKEENKENLLKEKIKYKRFSKIFRTKDEASYTNFCLDNDLYLNLHIFDRHSTAGIGDNILPTFITGISDKEADKWVKETLMRLNEIKESYITGRYILWLSQQKNGTLSNISRQTLLVNNVDYTVYNIYTGLLKSSYKEVFSVLDKIANTINFYLKLDHPEGEISYRNIWYKDLKKEKKFEPAITMQNYRLFGIFSILYELGEEPSKIRNAIQHRHYRIGNVGMDEYDAPMFSDFSEETIDVYYKVKCAIIYLFNFISFCEKEREHDALRGGSMLGPMLIDTNQNLDSW